MPLFSNFFTKQKKYQVEVLLCCLISASLTSCSGGSSNTEEPGSASTKYSKKLKPHIHPENACLGERTHAHIGGEKEHVHSFKCEKADKNSTNAHIHPAKGKYPKIRHVHPNGSNEHSHH